MNASRLRRTIGIGIAAMLSLSALAAPSSAREQDDHYSILRQSGGNPNIRLWMNDTRYLIHADVTGNPNGRYKEVQLFEGYCYGGGGRGVLTRAAVPAGQGAVVPYGITPRSRCEYTARVTEHNNNNLWLSGWWTAPY
ncbi:hypothetical protein [Streptomyces ficellus]|uniref:N-acetylmuramoyl-L-alanine amidase n=1 Tax=Streptomyces ficellus TaxID=1977088 RepID=A0A6I6FFH7_9ACTN|nr:hypothetical protein [Streptomyces ficellus]QGV77845.1 hypothetical protein EIZ62_05980 [Streptomyces ficellus]